MPKAGCRARRTFRSTTSAASRRPHAGDILADLFARDGHDKPIAAVRRQPARPRAQDHGAGARACWACRRDDYALDDRLREIGYGHWEGSTLAADAGAAIPSSSPSARPTNGACRRRAARAMPRCTLRMRDWYDSLMADTVAVAHGGTTRALMVALGIETPRSAADLSIEQGVVYVFGDGRLRSIVKSRRHPGRCKHRARHLDIRVGPSDRPA